MLPPRKRGALMTKKQVLIGAVVLVVAASGLFGFVLAQWPTLSDPIKSAVIGGTFTLFSAAAGFGVVVYQLQQQGKNTRNANTEIEKLKLKKEIYEDIVEALRDASDAQVELGIYSRFAVNELNNYRAAKANGLQPIVPKSRAPKFIEKNGDLGKKVIRLITFVEKWLIVDPRLVVFQVAINVGLYDAHATFHGLFPVIMRALPVDKPGVTWTAPSDGTLNQINNLFEHLDDALGSLGGYIDDFEREMQNLLLVDLFAHKVPMRVPRDPKVKVVELAKHKELTAYFENETAWGFSKREAEAAADAALSTP